MISIIIKDFDATDFIFVQNGKIEILINIWTFSLWLDSNVWPYSCCGAVRSTQTSIQHLWSTFIHTETAAINKFIWNGFPKCNGNICWSLGSSECWSCSGKPNYSFLLFHNLFIENSHTPNCNDNRIRKAWYFSFFYHTNQSQAYSL